MNQHDDEPRLSDFEGELQKLQSAVARLESDDLTLEEAFGQWEAGSRSYAACRRILASARTRLESRARDLDEDEPVWEALDTAGLDDGRAGEDRGDGAGESSRTQNE